MKQFDLEYIPKLEMLYTICEMAGIPDQTAAYEYIILEGGRGGGKSETVAQVLILLATRVKTRILCTREIQKTMKDSVYRMLVDWQSPTAGGTSFNSWKRISRDLTNNRPFGRKAADTSDKLPKPSIN